MLFGRNSPSPAIAAAAILLPARFVGAKSTFSEPALPKPSVPKLGGSISADILPGLAAALYAANPRVDQALWLPALSAPMRTAGLITPRRIAAFLGQVSQEAGAGFRELQENLSYTHPERIHAVFPDEFPTIASAAAYVGQPQKLASLCYAHKLGNGGPATGDGWRFCGRGLIQLTGRSEYSQFAAAIGQSVEDAAAFAVTPQGAAASACWYWTSRKLNPFADAWDLAAITRHINGSAMEGHAERVAMAEAALHTFGG